MERSTVQVEIYGDIYGDLYIVVMERSTSRVLW